MDISFKRIDKFCLYFFFSKTKTFIELLLQKLLSYSKLFEQMIYLISAVSKEFSEFVMFVTLHEFLIFSNRTSTLSDAIYRITGEEFHHKYMCADGK
jgi:hypothetical protein